MLSLDDNGSNIRAFKHLFPDGTGERFRDAIIHSFSFASGVVRTVQELAVKHQLELWDQAVSYRLGEILSLGYQFAEGVEIHLEKQESERIWRHGFSIVKTDSNQRTRQWVLPDGLIQRNGETIALEFDHGEAIGKWADRLLKAIRALAAEKINGVIYCYCFDGGAPISKLSSEDLTDEFIRLVDHCSFGKPIGVLTIFRDELQVDLPDLDSVLNFLDAVYIHNRNKSKESRKTAEEIAKALKQKLARSNTGST